MKLNNKPKLKVESSKKLRGNEINWNQVFYFSEVAAVGSIKLAAAKLGLSSPTLSQHISQLEKDLEVTLFNRHHRRLDLTEQGSRLFQYAKQMFETGQRLIDVVSPVPLGCYPVSIGIVASPSSPIVYQLLSDYIDRFGPLSIKSHTVSREGLERGLAEAKFDFGFSPHAAERKDLVSEQFAKTKVHFYVKGSIANKPFSRLLSSIPLLVCGSGSETRTLLEKTFEEAELVPIAIITSDNPAFLLQLCEKGLGMYALSEGALAATLKSGFRCLRMPSDAPKVYDQTYLMWSKDGHNSEAVRNLRILLQERKDEQKS